MMAVAGALTLTAVPMATAQDTPPAEQGPPRPPNPLKPDEPPTIMNFLTMLIIIGVVIGANLIPSRRGHQD